MTKRVGRGGIEQVMQQKGWKGNSEGKMDRERWLCVILWTPFIYTWNKRPGLGCKRVSWWGLKWNWHFQFVLWHVCLGLFTHSSASPSLAILLSNPPFSLSLSLSLFLPYTSLQTSSPINLSLTFSHLPQSPPKRSTVKQGNMNQIPYQIYQTFPEKHMCTLYYKYMSGTWDSFQRRMPANSSKTDHMVCTGSKIWWIKTHANTGR